MPIEFVTETDIGRARDTNEDSVLAADLASGTLLAVADGMGGVAGGDVASETAIDAFESVLRDALPPEDVDLRDCLDEAMTRANEAVQEADGNPHMGTTLVGAVVHDGHATLVNVGDSRAYAVTDDGIEQVTVDQSLVQELVDAGTITPEEAETHPQRNVVSQALGTEDDVDPDYYEHDLDGTLLLCSDGLTEEVSDETIHEIVADHSDLESTATALVDRANENGGSDNISVVLAREA